MAQSYGGYGGYTTTTYGAQGGADGGGFMNQGFGSQQGSQDGGKQFDHENDNLTPLTIKQILQAEQAHPKAKFRVDNHDIVTLTFVAEVRSISVQQTNSVYKLDDGTSLIEARKWREPDSEAEPDITENTYVRVYGTIKSYNDKKHVGILAIRPVTDMNEVNMHLLEAAYVHLYFTRGAPEAQAANAAGDGNPMFVDSAGGAQGNGKALPPMSANARKVYNHLSQSLQTNEGLHVHMIAQQLKMSAQDVFVAADELLSLALIFTTVDDETWAVLEF